MKIGILGSNFGFEHAKIFNKFKDVEIIGLYGRNEEKLKEIEAELLIPTTTDMDSLINHPEIDLIDVVLPTKMHKQIVIQVLQADKHVFCETPLALTLEDALEMQKVAKDLKKEIFVGLFMLFSPEFCYPLEQSRSLSIGNIHSVYLSRRTPRIWGNMSPMILNLMIHDFDYIYALLGMPNSISSHQVVIPEVNGENIKVELIYDNCTAIIEGSSILPDSYPFSLTLHVNGTNETVEIHYPVNENYDTCEVMHYPKAGKKFKPPIEFDNEYKIECRYVVDYLSGKDLPRINQIDIAIKSLRLTLLAKKSYENQSKKIML